MTSSLSKIEPLSVADLAIRTKILNWRKSIVDQLDPPTVTNEWRIMSEKDEGIFETSSGAIELVRKKLKSVDFSLLQLSASAKGRTIGFYLNLFRRQKIQIGQFLAQVDESEYFSPDHVVAWNGYRLSSDLLRRLAIYDTIRKHVSLPDSRKTVLELGGGYGGFSRIFKSLHPDTTYIIVDLPNSLCYSAAFLNLNFPNARHLLVTPETATDVTTETVDQYDFVYVPTGLEQPFLDLPIDLFLNVYSFGEIPNKEIERWFERINGAANIKSIYLLNHFLNIAGYTYKPDGNAASILLGADWQVEAWELNPEYTEDPIETQLDLNYLEIVATRPSDPDTANRRRAALQDVQFARKLPWFKTVSRELRDRQVASSPLRRMVATRSGGLLHLLWDATRLLPCRETVETFVLYLVYINRNKHPYGETIYLRNLLNTLPLAADLTGAPPSSLNPIRSAQQNASGSSSS